MAHGTTSINPVTETEPNQPFTQTKNARVLINDGLNNRVVIGQSSNTGKYGLYVSQTGKDVLTADAGDLLFSSDQSAYRVVSANAALNSDGSTDNTSIQAAIDQVYDEGGGVVFLKNDTYLMSSDIVVPDNVILQGETGLGTIIDFQNQEYQIKVTGELLNDEGTVTAEANSTTVTGDGTQFDETMIGAYIMLKGRFFLIDEVPDQATLVIDQPFDSDPISEYPAQVAYPGSGTTLQDFTVQNSLHADGAVFYNYVQSCYFNGVTVLSSALGVNFNAASIQNAVNFFIGYCDTGLNIANSGVYTLENFEVYGSVGDNVVAESFYNVSIANATISSAGGNNLSATNCEAWSFFDFEITTAGANGLEFTNCTDLEISSMSIRESVNDGMLLTSGNSRIGVLNVTFKNNGGYGINIDADNDQTTIGACFFPDNTAGDVSDLGTNTVILDGQGLRYVLTDTQSVTKDNGTTSQVFSYAHDLNYAPAYLAYVTLGSGSDRVPYLSIDDVTGTVLLAIYVSVDDTNVNVTVVTPGDTADSGPWDIRYYLLNEAAD